MKFRNLAEVWYLSINIERTKESTFLNQKMKLKEKFTNQTYAGHQYFFLFSAKISCFSQRKLVLILLVLSNEHLLLILKPNTPYHCQLTKFMTGKEESLEFSCQVRITSVDFFFHLLENATLNYSITKLFLSD